MAVQSDEAMGKDRRYLSPEEFGDRSGLSLATVHRYLKKGKLPFHQPGGRRTRILIPIDALESVSRSASQADRTTAPAAAQEASPAAERPVPLPGPRPRWTRLDNHRD
jgi:excisionase family DNA binding protein